MGSYHKSMLLIKQAELKLYGYVFSYGLGSFCVQGKIRSPLNQKEPGCRQEGIVKIRQILNNNIALVQKGRNEIIVFSKGIAFRKKAGQTIRDEEIEKSYVLDSHDRLEHFSYLLANTDEACLDVTNEIVALGETFLKEKVSDYLYLTMLDHIDFALKRAKKGQFIQSPLLWEVKKFYPKHFQIGLQAVERLNKKFGVNFPDDEAVSIALHFVNLQSDQAQLEKTIRSMQTLKDILSIIQYHFHIHLDESSLNYSRLVTHLQYFIQRLQNGRTYTDNDKGLNEQVRTMYPQTVGCIAKIRTYVKENFKVELTIDEETYLALHIHRVTYRANDGKEKEDEV